MEMSPSRALPDGMTTEDFVKLMKARMEKRDRRLTEAEQANHGLRTQVSDLEQQLLKVANKLRLHQAKHETRNLQLMRENADLAEKLSAATGVDYLGAGTAVDGVDDAQPGSATGRESPSLVGGGYLDPAAAAGAGGGGGDDEQTDMLYTVVRKLQSKLNEAAAYNRTCRRAVKMLHSDLVAVDAELQRLRKN
jgi:hypothetical protein